MTKSMKISVVMPVYNSEGWVTKTVACIDKAVERSTFTAELVIINDGSTDGSLAEIKALKPKSKRLKIKIIDAGKNLGRYPARKLGVDAATHDHLLFVDSRVFIDANSLKYLSKKLESDPDQVWNGHVHVVKKGNVFARFWDALVCIAWRRYFGNPREVSYGLDDFDYYPKGTGFFFVSKKLLTQAMATFEKRGGDVKFSSDDTLLIRFIASKQPIHLSPQFSCEYNGRSTFKGFLKHAYHRGQFFVDGFLRPGNRFFVPLLTVLAASLVGLAALIARPLLVLPLLAVLAVIGMIGLFLAGLVFRLEWRDAASLAGLSPAFAAVYGTGIWRGVIRKIQAAGWKGLWHGLCTQRRFLGGTLLEYAIIFVLFSLLTMWFTGGVAFHINHELFVDGPGDGTAGFLWLNYAGNHLNPLVGHTDIVNYPAGASLGNPTYFTYLALWVPLWVLTHIFSPVIALNLVTFWGFIGSGLAMYWLVRRLTHNAFVALFAGFAVAFVPYHVVNSSSHLAYIFSIIFVLITAAFIGVWRKPTRWRAIGLAAAVALGYYTDGYYLLLGSVLLCALVFAGIVYEIMMYRRESWQRLWHRAKYLVVAVIALIVFSAPIAVVQLKYGSQVKKDLAQARGNPTSEMTYYAAWPIDYVIPPLSQPYFSSHSKFFNELQAYKNMRSNASESTLFVGWTMLALCAMGLALTVAYWIRGKGQTLNRLTPDQRKIFLLVATIVFIGVPILFLFSLKPVLGVVHGHTIWMPAYILVKLGISFWRVLARFFLPIEVLLVLFASLSLWALFQSKINRDGRGHKVLQAAVVLVLLVFLNFEYANGFNRPSFDFNKMPPAYTWLKDQKDVNAIVEFPLLGSPWEPAVYAVTAQQVHGKKLINLQMPQQDLGRRNGLVSIANPEAVDYAASRGAQIGVTHDMPCTLSYPWLTLAYDGTKDGHPIVCMYRMHPATSDRLFIDLHSGFADGPQVSGLSYYDLLFGNYVDMLVIDQYDHVVTASRPVSFSATLLGRPQTPFGPFTGTWKLLQDEKEITSGTITDSNPVPISATVNAGKPIQLRVVATDGTDPNVYQLALTDIFVTAQ